MKVSEERIFHFQCTSPDCHPIGGETPPDKSYRQWWTIADFFFMPFATVFCPACGHKNTTPENTLTGDDFEGGGSEA